MMVVFKLHNNVSSMKYSSAYCVYGESRSSLFIESNDIVIFSLIILHSVFQDGIPQSNLLTGRLAV